jgi:hypothetical protein
LKFEDTALGIVHKKGFRYFLKNVGMRGRNGIGKIVGRQKEIFVFLRQSG